MPASSGALPARMPSRTVWRPRTWTAQALTIEVDWRRGGRSGVRGVRPNREYEITEPPGSPGLRPGSAAPPPRAEPWFRDVSAQLGHRHVETPFNDWARQPLLPQ